MSNMFKGLEIARNFCLGGLSVIPPEDKATDYDRGMRAGLKMVQEFIEREQKHIKDADHAAKALAKAFS